MATSLEGVHVPLERINEIKTVADHWALGNGISMKAGTEGDDDQKYICAPYTLFPSVIPGPLLQQAQSVMTHFNSLMHKVANDHQFMEAALKNVIEVDDFIARLWNIYTHIREEGIRQPYMLGMIRNDFMMNVTGGQIDAPDLSSHQLSLKQIEINLIASSFSGLVQPLTQLHRLTLSLAGKDSAAHLIPENLPCSGLADGLVKAWQLYNNPRTVIMFIVLENETNIMDQRSLEFNVYYKNAGIRVVRKTLLDVATRGKLNERGSLTVDNDEVAVIYLRDGYTSANYKSEKEWEARMMMERSTAIKAPSVQHQLAGTKKIQQELARPGCLERFIQDKDVVRRIRDTFAGQFSLDLGPEGDQTIEIALANPNNFVVKPQREGGGNNLYGADITRFLEQNKDSKERNAHILMERIFPWQQKNYLVKVGQPFQLHNVISELGIYGVIIASTDCQEAVNYECGYMMRTKPQGTDEGGIASGFAVLDTPVITEQDSKSESR